MCCKHTSHCICSYHDTSARARKFHIATVWVRTHNTIVTLNSNHIFLNDAWAWSRELIINSILLLPFNKAVFGLAQLSQIIFNDFYDGLAIVSFTMVIGPLCHTLLYLSGNGSHKNGSHRNGGRGKIQGNGRYFDHACQPFKKPNNPSSSQSNVLNVISLIVLHQYSKSSYLSTISYLGYFR